MGNVQANQAGDVSSETVQALDCELRDENPRRFSHSQLSRYTSGFSNRIGSGASGQVYKGQFPHGGLLAVKVLEGLKETASRERAFKAEVSTIGRTRHRRLVKLYGFCYDADMVALVYEFIENGSLDKILFENKLDWARRYNIALETAKAISYLHEGCDPRVIHYDIKPANVLIDSNYSPKLSDFGLAMFCGRDLSHITLSAGRGTVGYIAPELSPDALKMNSCEVTYKCDVYSFGMMLFDILRCKGKNGSLDDDQERFPILVRKKSKEGKLDQFLSECGIEEKDRDMAKTISKVALRCSQHKAKNRPKMSAVVVMLEEEILAEHPPNPVAHMSSSSPAHLPLSSSPTFLEKHGELRPPSEKSNAERNHIIPDKKESIMVLLKVKHCGCEGCTNKIKNRLSEMKGVENVKADLQRSQVTVEGIIDAEELVKYVHDKTKKEVEILHVKKKKWEEITIPHKTTEGKE